MKALLFLLPVLCLLSSCSVFTVAPVHEDYSREFADIVGSHKSCKLNFDCVRASGCFDPCGHQITNREGKEKIKELDARYRKHGGECVAIASCSMAGPLFCDNGTCVPFIEDPE